MRITRESSCRKVGTRFLTGQLLAEEPRNGLSPEASTQPPGVPPSVSLHQGTVDSS